MERKSKTIRENIHYREGEYNNKKREKKQKVENKRERKKERK